jgi:hypothetical protein
VVAVLITPTLKLKRLAIERGDPPRHFAQSLSISAAKRQQRDGIKMVRAARHTLPIRPFRR